ncbi:hypothetical protein ABG067_007145 [Albugo candida]
MKSKNVSGYQYPELIRHARLGHLSTNESIKKWKEQDACCRTCKKNAGRSYEYGCVMHNQQSFGALGFAHIDKSKRSKLDKKTYKGMFLG